MKIKLTIAVEASAKICKTLGGPSCHLCIDMMPFAHRGENQCMAFRARDGQGVVLKLNRAGDPLRCRACLKNEVAA